MPGKALDDVVEDRDGKDNADRSALRKDRRRQGTKFVREPLVEGVKRHRIGGSFARTQYDATGEQRRQAYRADHWKLGQGPDHGHRQQHPPRLNMVDDETGRDRREREQEEEAGVHQTELLGREIQLLHDRHTGKPMIALSAKLIIMKKNSRATIAQPPFCATGPFIGGTGRPLHCRSPKGCRWQFIEQVPVFDGETAKFPEAVRGCDLGDRGARRIGVAQGATGEMHSPKQKIAMAPMPR